MPGKKRAPDEGTLIYGEQRDLWVGRLPRSLDPKRRAVYGRTQAEARDKLRAAMRDAERGLVTLTGSTRLGDYLDHWLTVIRSRVESGSIAPSTAAGYERDVRLQVKPRLGRVPLRKLTPGQVEAALGAMQAHGYKPWSVRHVRTTLSSALSDAQRDELVARNVARLVDPPKVDKRHPSAFSVEEWERIVAVLDGHRLGALFRFIGLTGLRRSEALGLEWRDVDLDAGTFRVREGLHQITAAAADVVGETGLVGARPKSDASGDELPLSAPAVELLREHRKGQTAERLACPQAWPDDPERTAVFASAVGTPLHPSNVSRAWRQVLERADVAHRTGDDRPRGMHELRRTFATRLRDAGIPLEDVQRLGRWASSKMLLEVYAASDDRRLREAAEAAGKVMGL